MAEAFVNVTEGSGKKVHAFDRTIGANTVLDEGMFQTVPYFATYTFEISAASLAIANSHILAIQAGTTLNVYIVEIALHQMAAATGAQWTEFDLRRITVAGTGGTARTGTPHDLSDAAAGATAIQLPTPGTIGNGLMHWAAYLTQTPGVAAVNMPPLVSWSAMRSPLAKPIRISPGVNNGVALRVITASAGATASGYITVVETNFT